MKIDKCVCMVLLCTRLCCKLCSMITTRRAKESPVNGMINEIDESSKISCGLGGVESIIHQNPYYEHFFSLIYFNLVFFKRKVKFKVQVKTVSALIKPKHNKPLCAKANGMAPGDRAWITFSESCKIQ